MISHLVESDNALGGNAFAGAGGSQALSWRKAGAGHLNGR
jgi:hypothetical protein